MQCKNKGHLIKATRQIMGKGGEGVILRRPNSLYEPGRSESLRKFKVSEKKENIII